MNTQEIVLVTGGSGFLAVHCIIQLLNVGHPVKAILPNRYRENSVRPMLREGGIPDAPGLSFLQADLSCEDNWREVARGCTYALHVASPTPKLNFKHEDEMIIPSTKRYSASARFMER